MASLLVFAKELERAGRISNAGKGLLKGLLKDLALKMLSDHYGSRRERYIELCSSSTIAMEASMSVAWCAPLMVF